MNDIGEYNFIILMNIYKNDQRLYSDYNKR